jgi:hypothetical protein
VVAHSVDVAAFFDKRHSEVVCKGRDLMPRLTGPLASRPTPVLDRVRVKRLSWHAVRSGEDEGGQAARPALRSDRCPYPPDFQIYMPGITLAGIPFREEDDRSFPHSRNQTIKLEREHANSHY